MVKASDMLIARRANTKARADFATWQMMAKLNGADGLTDEARKFLASFQSLSERMSKSEAEEETIAMVYAAYFEAMGGVGLPPPIKHVLKEREATPPFTNNVTPLKRPPPKPVRSPPTTARAEPRKLPVMLIFVAMIIIAVAIRYFWH